MNGVYSHYGNKEKESRRGGISPAGEQHHCHYCELSDRKGDWREIQDHTIIHHSVFGVSVLPHHCGLCDDPDRAASDERRKGQLTFLGNCIKIV